MGLSGFTKSCTKRSGGVAVIRLIEAESIDNISYNRSSDTYTALSLASGASLQRYEFTEDTAVFDETVNENSGSFSVEHRLTFSMGKLDSSSRKAMEELLEASYGGIVAVITTSCGDSFVVGYSQEFGIERPLRLSKGSGSTGQRLRDATQHTVTLSCEDVSFARVLNTTAQPV